MTTGRPIALPGLPQLGLPRDTRFVIVSRMILLALLLGVTALASSSFLTTDNLLVVLRQAALQFLLASGLTLVILTGGIDLSIGAVLGLSACLGASLIVQGHVWSGVGAALGVGLVCGLANGLLVGFLKMPAFIVTYGMLWIAHGLGYVFMKGEVIYGLPEGLRAIGAGRVGPIPVPVLIAAALCVVLHVMLHRMRLGRAIYAIGGNAVAARLSGMPVRGYVTAVYGLSGLLAGLAGLVLIARVNAADSGVGEDLLLPAIAAVCLGGTSLFGGHGGIIGTAIGSIILAIILNAMNLMNVNTLWQPLVMGCIIALMVLSDMVLGGQSSQSKRT